MLTQLTASLPVRQGRLLQQGQCPVTASILGLGPGPVMAPILELAPIQGLVPAQELVPGPVTAPEPGSGPRPPPPAA